ncbi:MAG: general secretion pathway protein GspK [Planctomycetes bacterium]|nr:general secretion pathway protein GspK [Planctomycetota bacterium]
MRRRGTILIAVLILMTMGSLVAAALMFRMRAEILACSATQASEQAYAAAMSGIEKAMAVLSTSSSDEAVDWCDNEEAFRDQFVTDDGANRWYFTVYSYNADDESCVRYGLTDQAGKININVADEQTLLALPNMTRELVDCLLDFRDRDNEPRPEGAEQEYYSLLNQPYRVKNGPFVSIEELLLVKGFNASIIFGEDANYNSLLDANEDDGDESFPDDDGNGLLDRGLKGSAVAISYEFNVDNAGRPRININGDLADLDSTGLSEETLDFIRMYRAEGNVFKHASELLKMRYRLRRDAVDGDGQVTVQAGQWIESLVDKDSLADVLDRLTTLPAGRETPIVGLLNVNTASHEALAAIAGIDESLASSIVDARMGLDPRESATIAWLYTQGVVDAETFRIIAPKLTARSLQFHLRCVGFAWPRGQFRIVEAVIDLAGRAPRITYLRDITRLGLPFAINMDEELVK